MEVVSIQSSWNLHDINALGHMYGYRTNYKSEDTIYTFSPSINIYQTIHDMGGNDTIYRTIPKIQLSL